MDMTFNQIRNFRISTLFTILFRYYVYETLIPQLCMLIRVVPFLKKGP